MELLNRGTEFLKQKGFKSQDVASENDIKVLDNIVKHLVEARHYCPLSSNQVRFCQVLNI